MPLGQIVTVVGLCFVCLPMGAVAGTVVAADWHVEYIVDKLAFTVATYWTEKALVVCNDVRKARKRCGR